MPPKCSQKFPGMLAASTKLAWRLIAHPAFFIHHPSSAVHLHWLFLPTIFNTLDEKFLRKYPRPLSTNVYPSFLSLFYYYYNYYYYYYNLLYYYNCYCNYYYTITTTIATTITTIISIITTITTVVTTIITTRHDSNQLKIVFFVNTFLEWHLLHTPPGKSARQIFFLIALFFFEGWK